MILKQNKSKNFQAELIEKMITQRSQIYYKRMLKGKKSALNFIIAINNLENIKFHAELTQYINFA